MSNIRFTLKPNKYITFDNTLPFRVDHFLGFVEHIGVVVDSSNVAVGHIYGDFVSGSAFVSLINCPITHPSHYMYQISIPFKNLDDILVTVNDLGK